MKFSNCLFLAIVLFQPPQVRGAGPTVEELVAKLAARNSESVSIRAKLTVTDTVSGVRNATQILVKQRSAGDVRNLLYQVLWPASRKGEALCLEKSASGVVTGFFFEPPDKVTPFSSARWQDAYLDSNLSLEDLTEDFWQWPSQKITGEELLNGEVCQILDSSPPAGLHSSYSLIRTWVAPAKTLPLRIEKFGRDGRLAKRFIVSKVAKHDKTWMPVTTVIETPGQTRQTNFEISRGERGIELPLSDFSLDNIRKFARSAPAQSGKHE
jgi:outer membrane lipoprotein-sorting protein